MTAQTGLTAYDACYASLACSSLDLPLVTADQPLAKAVPWLRQV